jgi:S-formylglutathione hydrolase FrmB
MAVTQCDYYSRARVGFQSFTAVLPIDPPPEGFTPRDYAAGPWPTLYLLHGFSGNRNDWLLRSDIETLALRHGWAVIMPDGANRFYLDNPDIGELYGTYVAQELVEVTRKLFPLSRERAQTAIGGLSMGGYGAIRNGLAYAGTFGAIVGLSSALITDEVAAMTPEGGGNAIAPYGYFRHTFGEPAHVLGGDKDPKWLAQQQAAKADKPRLFLACGTEDFLYAHNEDFHRHLNQVGYEHEWWSREGVHDFVFWNQALPVAMDWLARA